jgi:dynein heavy chain
MVDNGGWASLPVSFSAQTSALRTQEGIESKLDKKKKTLLGPPPGKRMALFVDDVNMPALEEYGASPPVELLRQFLDFRGFYDRQKLFWKAIEGVTLISGCGPPGGGRNALTPRFVRHHTVMAMTQPSSDAMKQIFSSIMDGHLAPNGNAEVMGCTKPIVESTVDLLFKPSPLTPRPRPRPAPTPTPDPAPAPDPDPDPCPCPCPYPYPYP